MHPLAERYLQHVAQHLPNGERAEIERDLRSQIEDTLEGRHGPAPAEAEVAAVLKELGAPRELAASYAGPRSLVGPTLYPYLREVLRVGWMIVPAMVLVAHVVRAFGNTPGTHLVTLGIQAGLDALWSGVTFTGVVVLIFVLLEREGVRGSAPRAAFDPLALPPVTPDHRVDHAEIATGMAVNLFGIAVLAAFINAGGLTWTISLVSQAPVVPAPLWAMAALLVSLVLLVAVNLLVIARDRWTFSTWLVETVVEALSVLLLYVGILRPLGEWIGATVGAHSDAPSWLRSGATTFALVVLIGLAVSLGSHVPRLLRLWRSRAPTAAQTRR